MNNIKALRAASVALVSLDRLYFWSFSRHYFTDLKNNCITDVQTSAKLFLLKLRSKWQLLGIKQKEPHITK